MATRRAGCKGSQRVAWSDFANFYEPFQDLEERTPMLLCDLVIVGKGIVMEHRPYSWCCRIQLERTIGARRRIIQEVGVRTVGGLSDVAERHIFCPIRRSHRAKMQSFTVAV